MTADPTRLREALAERLYRRAEREHDYDWEWWADEFRADADAILAALPEHRDDVLAVLGMEVVGHVWQAKGGLQWGGPDGIGHVTERPVYAFRPEEQP